MVKQQMIKTVSLVCVTNVDHYGLGEITDSERKTDVLKSRVFLHGVFY